MPSATIMRKQAREADKHQWDENFYRLRDGHGILCDGQLPNLLGLGEPHGRKGKRLRQINRLQRDLVQEALKTDEGMSIMIKRANSKEFRQTLDGGLTNEYEGSIRKLTKELRSVSLRTLQTQHAESVVNLHRHATEALLELDYEERDIALSYFPPDVDAAYAKFISDNQGQEIDVKVAFARRVKIKQGPSVGGKRKSVGGDGGEDND